MTCLVPRRRGPPQRRFSGDVLESIRTALLDLKANFAEPSAQGPLAYVEQMTVDHPDLDPATLAADAVLAVAAFERVLLANSAERR